MKLSILAGTTGKLLDVFIQDSSSTTGAGLTGLVFNSAGLTGYYYREGAASAVAITLATMTLGTWATGGFIVVDGTNMPGCYQLGVPDAAVAAGAKSVLVMLKGAANMAALVIEIELTAWNNQDAVRGGLTALPNVSSGSAGAIPTTGTGANQISVSSGQVLLQAGTAAGQLDFTSGVVKANLAQILGTALTETAGQLAGGFKKWFDVAAPVGTVNSIPNATAGAAGGLFIAGTNAATTITTALTTTFTGNLTGSVASVTAGVTLAASAVQAIWDAATSALTTVGSIGKRLADFVTGDAFVRLGAPAGASVSADIASVKTDTGTTIPGRLPTALTAGGNMKSDIVAIDGDTNAQTRLKRGTLSTVLGTCAAGGTTTSVIASSLTDTAVDSQFVGRVIIFDTGTATAALRGQATSITAYTHATKTFTVTAMTTAPAINDTFTIL